MGGLKQKLKLLGYFTSYDVLNKAIMFLTGILVVRHMDKFDYAYYTLTHTVMGSMAMLSTLGAGTALLSLGGKSVDDPVQLGIIRATVIRYRKFFAAISLPVVGGTLIYMLHQNDCPFWLIALLFLLSCIGFLIQFQHQIACTIVLLKREYLVPQKAGLIHSAVRLLALLLLIPVFFSSWSVLAVSVCISAVTFFFILRPVANKHFAPTTETSAEAGKEIRRITYNTLPGTMMGFIMPNLSLLLIAVFGETANVAELGAIGRIMLVYSIPGAFAGSVIQPWIARETNGDALRKKVRQCFLFMTGAGVLIFAGTFVAQDYILMVLGDGYDELGFELVLFAAISSLGLSLGSLSLSLDSRGWVDYYWLNPIITICSMVIGLSVFRLDLSLLSGVILLGLFRIPPMFLHFMILLRRGYRREFMKEGSSVSNG